MCLTMIDPARSWYLLAFSCKSLQIFWVVCCAVWQHRIHFLNSSSWDYFVMSLDLTNLTSITFRNVSNGNRSLVAAAIGWIWELWVTSLLSPAPLPFNIESALFFGTWQWCSHQNLNNCHVICSKSTFKWMHHSQLFFSVEVQSRHNALASICQVLCVPFSHPNHIITAKYPSNIYHPCQKS